MNPKYEHKTVLSRRAFIFGAVQLGVIGVLSSRLYYLQFIKADQFTTLSENNRVRLQLIPPARGKIVDHHGRHFANNRKNYRILLEPEKKEGWRRTLNKLEAMAIVTPEKKKEVLAQQSRVPRNQPFLLREHLSWQELAKVEFHRPELPAASIDIGQVRHYPLAEKAAHVIGYVGAVSEKEQDKDQPLLKLPDFKIGKNGVEKMTEDRLRGRAGIRHAEVNAHGMMVRELERQDSIPGETLRLTLDARLQEYIYDRLMPESAAVIVLDLLTGGVLALVSTPGYDPNLFSRGIPLKVWQELNANDHKPLINKAIAGIYPPGSTFKMMTGLAALEQGVASAETGVYCPGHFYLGNHRFNCWKPEGHGTVNLKRALAESCDTYFYTLAHRMGIKKLAEICRMFGYGAVSGIGIPGESTVHVASPEWKQARYGQPWRTGDTINASIGQGYVVATPMQLAVMTARLCTGKKVVPTLLQSDIPRHKDGSFRTPDWETLPIDPEHLAQIMRGMDAVTNEPNGTAFARRIKEPGFALGGKTGTAQVRRITVRGQDQSKIPWRFRHHALFVGYAPVEKPRFVVSVVVEHGGGGSSAAAPVASDVLLKTQQLFAEGSPSLPAAEERKDP
jgi:penicillin-binding protein 2